jgi:carbon storage regulator
MLVLTRKAGQQILVGPDVAITVLAVDGDRVRLGIEAPEAIRVLRGELVQEVAAANGEAISDHEQILGRLLRHVIQDQPPDLPPLSPPKPR